jgi:5'(3')-deoxyribonucleotidase
LTELVALPANSKRKPKSRRARFGIDIDGVMYMWDKTARYMLRTQRGYTRDQLGRPSRYWNEIKDIVENNDWQWLWSEGVRKGLFRYGHLYTGTIEAITALNILGDCVILTHRPREAVQDTLDWLSYLKLPFMEVQLFTNGEAKSAIKCDMYVDDKPENCIDFNDNTEGLPLLWRRESNENFDCYDGTYTDGQPNLKIERESRIQPISTWAEVIDFAQSVAAEGIINDERVRRQG